MSWFKSQYDDVKGNLKFAVLAIVLEWTPILRQPVKP